jgi:hypothetical protein
MGPSPFAHVLRRRRNNSQKGGEANLTSQDRAERQNITTIYFLYVTLFVGYEPSRGNSKQNTNR